MEISAPTTFLKGCGASRKACREIGRGENGVGNPIGRPSRQDAHMLGLSPTATQGQTKGSFYCMNCTTSQGTEHAAFPKLISLLDARHCAGSPSDNLAFSMHHIQRSLSNDTDQKLLP